jgi:hypothetical protein
MAVLAYPGNLATAQAGTGDSTNIISRAATSGEVNLRPMILRVTTNAGTTITFTIKGSVDGTTYYNVPYSVGSDGAAAITSAAITTTTAKTELYILAPAQPWIFLKTNVSANTGMTPTTDLL